VLLFAKISVNCNEFCVSTSVFATLILSIVRKEELMVSACLCDHVFHPTLKTCPTRCAFFLGELSSKLVADSSVAFSVEDRNVCTSTFMYLYMYVPLHVFFLNMVYCLLHYSGNTTSYT
jgi:hypothetical protein